MAEKEITYEEVSEWILKNRDDEEAMNSLNKLTFPYTTKYKERELQH